MPDREKLCVLLICVFMGVMGASALYGKIYGEKNIAMARTKVPYNAEQIWRGPLEINGRQGYGEVWRHKGVKYACILDKDTPIILAKKEL